MTVLERFALTDRTAIVTGAGRGIGAASAVALAEAGADVVLCARTESQVSEVAERVSATGRRALPVTADLTDPAKAADLVAQTVERFGRLDVVVNNIGGSMPSGFLDTSAEDLTDAFSFNVGSAHELTRAAVKPLLEHDHGSVVNISSAIARVAGRGYLAYGTAKAALSHYTRLAARDLAPRIRVNAIEPGAIATSALEVVTTDDALRNQVEQASSLGRIGTAEEIAAAVVFLASDTGSFVTGKTLEVDGGTDQASLDLGLPDL